MLQNPVSTRCGHSFCNMCVDHLFTGKKTALCPLCNTSVTRRGIVVNEKIKLLLKCARSVITAAQKDIADIGFCDSKCKSVLSEKSMQKVFFSY